MNENIIGMICKTVFGSSCAIGGGIAISKLLDIWEVKSAERAKRQAAQEKYRREQERITNEQIAEKTRIATEKREKELREFEAHIHLVMTSRDFESVIRNASTHNKKLDMDDRLHAKELLEIEYSKLMKCSSIDSFDKQLGRFDQLVHDIYTPDADANKAAINYWWNKYEKACQIREENRRKQAEEDERLRIERKEEEERKRIAEKEEEERKRIEKQVMKEREQMYEAINRGIQTIGNVANSAIVNK